MVPVGLKSSINYFTGKYIGKGKVEMAHRISNLCMVVAWAWAFILMIGCWFGKEAIFNLYTNNEEVIIIMGDAWWVLIIFILFDCL